MLDRHRRFTDMSSQGLVAEWLRRGLQILAPRFDSGRGLQKISSQIVHNQTAGVWASAIFYAIGLGNMLNALLYGQLRALFLGSSVVEQPAVNRLVAGSNPARGAI